jgi:hypothetical protein
MIRMPCTAESVTLPKVTDRLATSESEKKDNTSQY